MHYESETAGASTVSVTATVTAVPTAPSAVDTLATFILDHNLPDSTVGVGSIKILGHADGRNSAGDKDSKTSQLSKFVNVYSFALKPEEHQPSGTCNFSRIDNAKLDITTSGGMTASDNIYAVNYNVLRIMSGMGGLAYSN